jgi:hypothetical protein
LAIEINIPIVDFLGLGPIVMDWRIGHRRLLLPNKSIAWALLVQKA